MSFRKLFFLGLCNLLEPSKLLLFPFRIQKLLATITSNLLFLQNTVKVCRSAITLATRKGSQVNIHLHSAHELVLHTPNPELAIPASFVFTRRGYTLLGNDSDLPAW